MADTSWPDDLPDKQFLEIGFVRQNGSIRTNMDKGPDKVRSRSSATVQRTEIPMILDGNEMENLDDFYENDLNGGSKKFDWEHPINDDTVEMRFIEPPQNFSCKKGGSKQGDRIWEGAIKLEILPS